MKNILIILCLVPSFANSQLLSIVDSSGYLMFVNPSTGAKTYRASLTTIAAGSFGSNAYSSTSYAPLASPTFTGTVAGITATMVGLGNVTNESKSTMFGSPTFTGTVTFPASTSFTTPALGAATATSINGNTFTTGTYTLTGVAGKTLTFNKSITLEGTDATVMTFPTTSKTVAANDGSNLTISGQAIGDLMVASSTTAYGKLAAVATGSFLRSAGTGTAPVWSTLTIPNAATTGDVIVATGSNALGVVAVNATANKVLMSGASAVPTWSTPTFPNASATTRKIIVSDGTNWTASTETYAVPGTSGNLLISDGTNWTSAVRYPIQVATADIAATASATNTATLFTPTADGMYRLTIYMKITVTGTSPVAGPVTITYTDADGSVAQSHVMLLQNTSGAVVTTTVNNNTATGTVNGSMVMNAKSGTAITYAIAVSGTFAAGRYTAHFTCERIK